jgi:CRISPR-associated endonuclease/helicase Cas3
MLLSHPETRLVDHLTNVKNIGLDVFDNKKGLKFFCPHDEIRNTLETVLFYHDIGKATIFFQDYLKASIEKRQCEHKQDLINHSLISALITSHIVKVKTGNEFLSALAFVVVRKHHGDLENFNEMLTTRKKDILQKQFLTLKLNEFPELKSLSFKDLWDEFEEILWIEIDSKIENYFLLNFIFSILTYSDKTEVIFGKLKYSQLPKDIAGYVDNYKKNKFNNDNCLSSLNRIRNTIYEESIRSINKVYRSGKIYSLNVPTGSGKTLAALNLAFKLLEKEKSLKRVIYALPFTSIVDQTEDVIKDIFKINNTNVEDFLIVHHHLAEIKIKYNEDYIEKDKAQVLVENWDKPLILTTFWQLFYTLISNKNSQLRKFHNIANSVIILDEVQTIPYKYWNLTKEIFKNLIDMFNCRVIFLTATMPLIFQEEETLPLISKDRRNEYFSLFSRYKLNVLKENNAIARFSLDCLYEIAKKDIKQNADKSFLFVFNTINSSLIFYDKLKKEFCGKDLVYLSTNILPIKRKERIKEIKNNPSNKIVVSTQLVEAGVDIDLDIVYRDFAPLDSIVQSAGRCNRSNNKKKGRVVLFKIKNEKGKFDHNYIYEGLSLTETENLFLSRSYFKESELLIIINEYYEKIKQNSSQDDSLKILESIKNLDYKEIQNKFKLIDEIPSFLMFFEINNEASNLLKYFKSIFSISDKFDRKAEFLKIKSKFYQYVLSVRYSINTINYTSFEEIGNFKIVERDFVQDIYDYETGLKKELSNFI